MLSDLTKAYACLDRDLAKYGTRCNMINWFKFYINTKRQMVKVTKDETTMYSRFISNGIGIAQSSVVGSILVILFINYLWLLMNSSGQDMI